MSFESYGVEEDLAIVMAWVEDAVRDGWLGEVTKDYRLCRLNRGGFSAQIIATPSQITKNGNQYKCHASIRIWGPDEMSVDAPIPYCWKRLQENMKMCKRCGKTGETVRLGFAERVCSSCRERWKSIVESTGWTS